jgi:hypothetical protein
MGTITPYMMYTYFTLYMLISLKKPYICPHPYPLPRVSGEGNKIRGVNFR